MKVNIELPFFPGFYESDLENSDTAYYAIQEELDYYHNELGSPYKGLVEEDLDFNYADYESAVRDAFVSVLEDYMPEFVLSIEDVEMTSPRYYNFETDRLWADIELADNWEDEMRSFIASNYDWLQERIHEDWTSYDGFMSFMDNDIDKWGEHLFTENDGRYISTMIAYMMLRANKDIRNEIIYGTLEDIYPEPYVYLTESGEAKVNAGLEEEDKDDPAQLSIPFED